VCFLEGENSFPVVTKRNKRRRLLYELNKQARTRKEGRKEKENFIQELNVFSTVVII